MKKSIKYALLTLFLFILSGLCSWLYNYKYYSIAKLLGPDEIPVLNKYWYLLALAVVIFLAGIFLLIKYLKTKKYERK
ncbi:MAG: hypothetical protein ACP5OG_03060 [Candidatus Nanoarchaeia archaeon]